MFAVLGELLIQIFDNFTFVVIQQTSLDVMVERGKTLFDARRNVREDHGDTKTNISHNCTPHDPSLFYNGKHFDYSG